MADNWRKDAEKGFSLIEVLVSLLLLSIVLFGLDAEQVYAIKELKNTYFFSIAANQMNNAAERLWTLGGQAGLDQQLMAWNAENHALLPEAMGTITGSFPEYVVTLTWGGEAHACLKPHIGPAGCLRQNVHLA